MDKDKKEAIDTELEKVGITLSTETLNLLSSQVSEAIINSDISNKVLVTATDIARMVSYKPFSSAMRKIIESPDFPKPFSIVGHKQRDRAFNRYAQYTFHHQHQR